MGHQEKIVKDGVYEHYKGKKYKVIDVVLHSETLEELVLYETLHDNKLSKLWVRPKAMFQEALPDGTPRFKLTEEQ